MKEKVVNVLGTPYAVLYKKKSEDKLLEEADGWCDNSTKIIMIRELDDDPSPRELDDFAAYQKQVLRHEIVHAFHMESGLQNCLDVQGAGFPELIVDWFAIQGPKIMQAWKEADAL